MTNNEATLSLATSANSNIHADNFSVSKAFYDQVRSDFLRQSARYLRASSLSKQQVWSCYTDSSAAQG
jgi:hypothetical protein